MFSKKEVQRFNKEAEKQKKGKGTPLQAMKAHRDVNVRVHIFAAMALRRDK